jgi:hypothetical protein
VAQPIPLSQLSLQLQLLKEQFEQRYPHPWLVWEPTEYVKAATPQEANVAVTRMPTSFTRRPRGADAFCYPVGPDGMVTVGRADTNHIAIDDMSMSRNHFLLYADGPSWFLALAEPVTCATFVRRICVEAKKPIELVDSCHITAGDVELTFYDRSGVTARLAEEAKRRTA